MRWLRALFHTLGASLSLALSTATAVLVMLLAGAAWWASSEGSLAHVLQRVNPLLPAGQSLQVRDVQGSLRDGGRLGHVVWKRGPLTVEVQDLQLAWDWHAALRRELRLTTAHAAALHIDDRSPANTEPLGAVQLPLHVDATFQVDRLQWAGPPALALSEVQGHYRFDGQTHTLAQAGVRMASGSYRLDGQVQAAAPGALHLEVNGTVDAPVRLQQQIVTLAAQAKVNGTLYGKDAALDVVVDLQPHATGKTAPLGGMQAHVQATLHPAAQQPVVRANAQWSALDLARLWPQAPQTALSGQAQVQPDGKGWGAELQVLNGAEGPISQNRLPLQKGHASLQYRSGQWQLQSLQAFVAGGSVTAQGSLDSAAQWSVRAVLQDVNPARFDPRWATPALDGEVAAHPTPQGIVFDAQLAGSSRGHAAAHRLQAKGLWSAPLLRLDSLQIQTPDAQLAGQGQLDTRSWAFSGQMQAAVPGAQGSLDGNAAAQQGQGSTQWQVKDARALQQWLAQLPWVGGAFDGVPITGDADVSVGWSGGWQGQGAGLQLDAQLRSKRLELHGLPLSDVRLEAKGSLQALAVQLHSKAQLGAAGAVLELQSRLAQSRPGQWHAHIAQLQAQVTDGLQPVPWALRLQQAVELDWQQSALVQSLAVSGGNIQLLGPAPGAAQLQWEPVQWQGGATPRWGSKGSLQGLPLAWLEVLGQTRLANLGLRGDLVFGGQWDARGGDGLQLRARVQRSSGDLQLLSGDANGGSLPAGLRDAHVEVQVERDALRAQLVWASDAGGHAQADLSTRLQVDGASVRWAPDAALQGTVRASLPRVGAWSLFAPVGWRINGTLDLDASLGGTRANLLWKGSLDARDMAIRSVVDGIDLSKGVMRLALDGRHMDVVEFSLQGAGGATGGQVTASGSVDWLPASAGTPLAQRLRMALDAKAQSFRVTARPDQRLVVSGNLAARLQDAKLVLRGVLVADQALIVLPDDTAPQLGSDVVVRRSVVASKPKVPTNDPASSLARTVIPDLQVVLDPGPNFQLQGHGINTRLTGQLTLSTQAKDSAPRLTGELRTANGFYRAYGQRLTIEEGTLRFTGAYDNPALDIRAVRPNLQQVVGVQVSGTAQLPVVRLFAEPDLSEMEKLSWLVLGRSSANGGGETAILQQAALALFAGKGASRRDNLVNSIGLDEVSLGQVATTNLDGTAGTEATVKFGKRLSRDFYVAYERSLAGTLGTLYVFYDLSRRFTLRGETGTTNAVDLIFTTRYD